MEVPRFLYRYRSLRGEQLSWVLRTIESSELYFSSPLMFNDPFEGYFGFDHEDIRRLMEAARAKAATSGIASEMIDANYNRALDHVEDYRISVRNDYLGGYGMLSFSESFDNILLWSHYADSHRGLCLEFDIEHFDGGAALMSVDYAEECPLTRIDPEFAGPTMVKSLTTKASIWSYEREWRMIRKGPGTWTFPGAMLTGVIFGSEIEREAFDRVLGAVAARNPRISIGKAVKDPWAYRVRVSRLGPASDRGKWSLEKATLWEA